MPVGFQRAGPVWRAARDRLCQGRAPAQATGKEGHDVNQMYRWLAVLAACVGLVGLAPASAGAADLRPVLVQITDQGFAPPQVYIDLKGGVTWRNTTGQARTVTSEVGVWDSGEIQPSDAYQLVFETPGTYYYYD